MNHEESARFWREQSYYHQHRADTWKKVARVLAGVLAGITIIAFITLGSS